VKKIDIRLRWSWKEVIPPRFSTGFNAGLVVWPKFATKAGCTLKRSRDIAATFAKL
jgi:hypothetical protein